MSGALAGVATLVRAHLRRDRWMLAWWLLGGVLLFWTQAVSVAGLYATQAELDTAAAALERNGALVAMAGPARALETVGGQTFWQASAFGAIVAGLMSMFLVGRHTRAEEESGRDELLRSTATGRHAPLAAAYAVAFLANLLLGVATAAALLTVRQDSPLAGMPLPVVDSLATGAGLAAVGWVFSGTALVAAQLTQSTRAMYGVAGAVLGVAYVLRAVGDLGDGVLSWLSPIGWYQAMQPYAGVRWWPLAVLVAAAAANVVLAAALFARRDVGSGLLATRAGPAVAGPRLRSGLGLAWRLHRGGVYGWTLGLALMGLAYGSIGDGVEDLLGDSDFARDAISGGAGLDPVDGFYATSAATLALVGAGFAISSALRPRAEEDAAHAESLLATALSRPAWLGGHVLVTVLGTVAVLVAGGAGLGLGYAATTGRWDDLPRYAVPILAYLAPVLALSALARLLYGCAPRLLALAWAPLAFVAVVLLLGDSLRLPQWLQDLSPFEHLALAPAETFRLTPVLVIAVLAAVVSAAGQLGFRRRDLG